MAGLEGGEISASGGRWKSREDETRGEVMELLNINRSLLKADLTRCFCPLNVPNTLLSSTDTPIPSAVPLPLVPAAPAVHTTTSPPTSESEDDKTEEHMRIVAWAPLLVNGSGDACGNSYLSLYSGSPSK
jgi:hypothetical protein